MTLTDSPRSASDTPVRVSQRDALKVAQIAAQRPPRASAARAAAQQYAEYSKECAGGCGMRVIPAEVLQELTERAQRALYGMGVRVAHKFGACKLCVVKVRKQRQDETPKPSREELAEEKRRQVTELWEKVRISGGRRNDLAAALGVSRQGVDYLIKKYGLPVEPTLKERAAAFEEELEFFLSCGLGVHEMAGRFGLTAEQLVHKVDSLRNKGKTTIRFDGWHEMEAAA